MVMFYLNVKKGFSKFVEIEASLENYYKMLDCTTIDIVERSIDGVYYDFICDDEGLFDSEVKPSGFSSTKETMFVGNLLVCLHDGQGNETGLEVEDMKVILHNLWTLTDGEKKWDCIGNLGY